MVDKISFLKELMDLNYVDTEKHTCWEDCITCKKSKMCTEFFPKSRAYITTKNIEQMMKENPEIFI